MNLNGAILQQLQEEQQNQQQQNQQPPQETEETITLDQHLTILGEQAQFSYDLVSM